MFCAASMCAMNLVGNRSHWQRLAARVLTEAATSKESSVFRCTNESVGKSGESHYD